MRTAEDFSRVYREFADIPSVKGATILPSGMIEMEYSQGLLTEEKRETFLRNFALSADAPVYESIGFPAICSSQIKMRKYSPSRKSLAVVRKPENENSGVSDVIEVYHACKILS